MTANAASDPEPHDVAWASADHATELVRLIRESFQSVGPHQDKVAKFFYGMLFSLDPATRDLFPANMQVQRDRLLRALTHIVQQVDRPDELRPFLHQLARDHRKFGVITRHYESLGIALIAAIKRYAGEHWSDEIERAWAEAYTTVARVMQEAAAEDEGPAWFNAEVVEHRRYNDTLAVITVRTDYPVPYRAGQYVSVEMPQRPRLWRYLSPANAPADDGTIEFHVRAVPEGWVSRSAVAHTRLGDSWRIAAPIGRLGVDRDAGRDTLLIAGGTGIAPMRAILEELAGYGENPNVHLFYGGRTPDDLYELDNLRRLAATCPWFGVTGVVETAEPGDGADSGDAADSEGWGDGLETGTLAEAVTRHGAWADHDVLLAGSPAMLRATVSQMLVAGTPLDRIHYDPFTLD